MSAADDLLARQRAAFLREARPDAAARRAALAALATALRTHEAALIAAVDADFGGRPAAETRLLELLPLYDQIGHARRHLGRWMRRRRVAGSPFLWPARAFWEYQPLGVVGVIGAWNYPVLLTLGPAVDAIAAGNRVVLKPSELAPRTAEALAALVASAFPPERVAVVTGGVEVARAPVARQRRVEHVAEPVQDHGLAHLGEDAPVHLGVVVGPRATAASARLAMRITRPPAASTASARRTARCASSTTPTSPRRSRPCSRRCGPSPAAASSASSAAAATATAASVP